MALEVDSWLVLTTRQNCLPSEISQFGQFQGQDNQRTEIIVSQGLMFHFARWQRKSKSHLSNSKTKQEIMHHTNIQHHLVSVS